MREAPALPGREGVRREVLRQQEESRQRKWRVPLTRVPTMRGPAGHDQSRRDMIAGRCLAVEARSRAASLTASILGHGASTGVIEEQRLRPALPKRRRRDGERDGGPQDGRPHCSDKDRVSTYGTLQGKVKLTK